MNCRTWVTALSLAMTCPSLFAYDVITKKSDGKKVNGTITDSGKGDITIKKVAGGDNEVISANDVGAIEWDGSSLDLRSGYNDENQGRYETALNRYTKAKSEAKSPSELMKKEFEYIIARVNGRLAMADTSKLPTAIKQLQDVQKLNPDFFRFYESVSLLGQLQVSAKDFDGARATFALLDRAPWPDYKLASKIASARILVAEEKWDEAATAFVEAAGAATDSPADQLRKYEAIVGQANALIGSKKYEAAIQILDEVTEKGPDDSALQAECWVQMGNSLQYLGKMKESALAYLHVDVLYPKESAANAEALYNLTKIWKQVQLPERSADAEAKLINNYPNSVWRKKL